MRTIDLNHFKTLIHARLKELEEGDELGEAGQSIVMLDQQSVGRLSRMDALQNQAMAQAQQTRREIEQRQLHAALHRISTEEFGYCDDCGEEIAVKRLELNPTATLCISCASG
ncbi:MAG: TraR/DksA family transcriptional regulator [Rhodobacteraceae bacterium]|nr:TraR/DksA family transcriptional regulator [Paracoccaceae bacterium]